VYRVIEIGQGNSIEGAVVSRVLWGCKLGLKTTLCQVYMVIRIVKWDL